MIKTVVFDFDGVIHSYTSGWQGINVAGDPPVDGINEAIQAVRQAGYKVAVVSSRCCEKDGMDTVIDYLNRYGIEVDAVTPYKPPAIVYIDDRAICFDGRPETLLEKIQSFKVWNKPFCAGGKA